MKLTALSAVCALSLTLLAVAALPTPPADTATETAAQHQPAQDKQEQKEWDPEEAGVGDLAWAKQPNPEEAGALNKTSIPIVRERFTPEQFLEYVKKNVVPAFKGRPNFRPAYIVLHNTAVPTIAQRPNGFTNQNMDSLAHYYGVNMGWKAGPHLFVDQNGIWVFSPLVSRGTHSPCFNKDSWGIEQLGDFQTESYDSGDGAEIRDNAVAAMAILSLAGNITKGPQNKNNPIRFHLEDTCTSHHCPGDHCVKDGENGIVARVEAAKEIWRRKWGAQ